MQQWRDSSRQSDVAARGPYAFIDRGWPRPAWSTVNCWSPSSSPTSTPVASRRCLHRVWLPAANQSRLLHLIRPLWGWVGFEIYWTFNRFGYANRVRDIFWTLCCDAVFGLSLCRTWTSVNCVEFTILTSLSRFPFLTRTLDSWDFATVYCYTVLTPLKMELRSCVLAEVETGDSGPGVPGPSPSVTEGCGKPVPDTGPSLCSTSEEAGASTSHPGTAGLMGVTLRTPTAVAFCQLY